MVEKLIAQIKLKPDFKKGEEIKRIYANYFEVTHTEYDFTFTFCDTDISALSRIEIIEELKKEPKELEIPIVAKIAIPTILVPKIIKALKINYEKYSQKLESSEFKK